MTTIGGLIFVLVCVFGSYIMAGGSMEPLIHALPHEMMTIGGAAIGTFIMANSLHDVKHALAGIGKALKGAAYKKTDYVDLLCLLYFFVRLASTKGSMALEPHIEKPAESAAFQKFPKLLKNHHTSDMICDYLRMIGMNADDPNQIEDVMARELKKTLHEELHSAHALQTMADGLPAGGGLLRSGRRGAGFQPDRWRAGWHLSWHSARLRYRRALRRAAQGGDRGGGEIQRGGARRARRPPARQCAAGERGDWAENGAQPAHAQFRRVGNRGAEPANRLIDGAPV